MRTRPRTILTMALWLCVGATISVGIAWACAAATGRRSLERGIVPLVNATRRGPRDWQAYSQFGFGCEITYSSWGYKAVTNSHLSGRTIRVDPTAVVSEADPWMWPAGIQFGGKERPSQVRSVSVSAGLPMRCLTGGWDADVSRPGSPAVSSHSAVIWMADPYPARPSSDWHQTVVFPLRPDWLRFLANAGIWGLVSCALMRAPVAAHKALRRRRGQCVRCAHPTLELAVCPECGHRAQSRPA